MRSDEDKDMKDAILGSPRSDFSGKVVRPGGLDETESTSIVRHKNRSVWISSGYPSRKHV